MAYKACPPETLKMLNELSGYSSSNVDEILVGIMLGRGGSGKSYVISAFSEFVNQFDKNGLSIGITSTTGVTAILLDGTTVHSFLGGGIGRGNGKNIRNVTKEKKDKFSQLRLLIVDEISFAKKSLIADISDRFALSLISSLLLTCLSSCASSDLEPLFFLFLT